MAVQPFLRVERAAVPLDRGLVWFASATSWCRPRPAHRRADASSAWSDELLRVFGVTNATLPCFPSIADFAGGKAHQGISQSAKRVWKAVKEPVEKQLREHKDYKLVLTGGYLRGWPLRTWGESSFDEVKNPKQLQKASTRA